MADQPPPTKDERTMATLAHVVQLFGWVLGPLVIFLLRRNSRFVAFHALQVFLFQCCLMAQYTIMVFVWIAALVATSKEPPGFFALLFGIWGVVWWTLALVLAIVYGTKASHGERADYPSSVSWSGTS